MDHTPRAAQTFTDGDLPDRCFAYVPDDVPSHRKLKLCSPDGKYDSGIIGAAKAALGKGYRGNRVQLPSSARAGVIAKVNRAAKAVGLDPFDASELDPSAFDDPDSSDVHVDGPMGAVSPVGALNRMRTRLKNKVRRGVKIDEAAIDEAHRHVKARVLPTKASEDDPAAFCDGGDTFPKLAKDDPRVMYRMASADNPTDDGDGDIDHCGACRFFQFGRCQLVEGTVEADHVCSLFNDRPVLFVNEADYDDDDDAPMGYAEPRTVLGDRITASPQDKIAVGAKLFSDLPADDFRQFLPQIKPFAEPPEWLHYLPKPGEYTHTSYGKVPMSKERIANFVNQFNAGVYQKNIPVDAEHQTKLSGATGWIREMRIAADGGAEARIEWTDRGKKLLASDRFKYFSPEWFDEWKDPVDEKVYRDVAIGGALTTRPYFKERALTPLAASEPGAIVWADDDAANAEPPVIRQRERTMAQDNAKETAPVAMTEEQITKRFAELEAKHAAELEAIRVAAEERATKLAAEVETERQAREQAEASARTKRFTDEVRGRSDANGSQWVGDIKSKVAMLEHLAKTAGEESDVFKAYVADQRAQAAQFKDSGLFKVFGSDADGEGGGTAAERLNAEARRIAAEKNVKFAVAYDEAVTANPKLYAEMRADAR